MSRYGIMYFLEQAKKGKSKPGQKKPELITNGYIQDLLSLTEEYRSLTALLENTKQSLNGHLRLNPKKIVFTYTPAHEVRSIVKRFNGSYNLPSPNRTKPPAST